jgi:hypothetical protein
MNSCSGWTNKSCRLQVKVGVKIKVQMRLRLHLLSWIVVQGWREQLDDWWINEHHHWFEVNRARWHVSNAAPEVSGRVMEFCVHERTLLLLASSISDLLLQLQYACHSTLHLCWVAYLLHTRPLTVPKPIVTILLHTPNQLHNSVDY